MEAAFERVLQTTLKNWESTMGAFLTADELADVIGCASNSYACMRRHLTRNGVPFIPNLRGFPQVDRSYFEARMRGTAQSVAPDQAAEAEPDFSAI
ncbi:MULTISPECIES: DUF4224 domain-containing protein [unclassified Cupriavidus]|uniref:DUF4224 domain-containing protein n=1 Tax=unclassified Cupriavidus TaxID=2640874 RepID=UPI001BFFD9BD|nr:MULTISPECIES: DUF4224 domain-containing protein [unclassified Cupriavidus]MCA3186569.1 DUF4224 domain-containing protein [Cupriavidus sp.]MCA3191670.1 DUF4224 domain-containing protein [Cupriavidus sp.]MCA3200340.1 DUF4224 domain-containing protein [Cupriavidus sp.]MCA3233184.1 DUF4224 domain-containing protein [Cupriavidus sp.]QWE93332.1 DUF4224 domain-containing protein [Cupriavidus sp. EM10]